MHASLETANEAVTSCLASIQDWIRGPRVESNGTLLNVIDGVRLGLEIPALHPTDESNPDTFTPLDGVQASIEKQDRAWLEFLDQTYILGEHVSLRNDIQHIHDWDGVVIWPSLLWRTNRGLNYELGNGISRHSEIKT